MLSSPLLLLLLPLSWQCLLQLIQQPAIQDHQKTLFSRCYCQSVLRVRIILSYLRRECSQGQVSGDAHRLSYHPQLTVYFLIADKHLEVRTLLGLCITLQKMAQCQVRLLNQQLDHQRSFQGKDTCHLHDLLKLHL